MILHKLKLDVKRVRGGFGVGGSHFADFAVKPVGKREEQANRFPLLLRRAVKSHTQKQLRVTSQCVSDARSQFSSGIQLARHGYALRRGEGWV